MAEENQDGQEKTEEPTQAAESRRGAHSDLEEVMVFTTLAAGLVLFMGLAPFVTNGLWPGLAFCHRFRLQPRHLGLAKVRWRSGR